VALVAGMLFLSAGPARAAIDPPPPGVTAGGFAWGLGAGASSPSPTPTATASPTAGPALADRLRDPFTWVVVGLLVAGAILVRARAARPR
jgi:hypothetical protein